MLGAQRGGIEAGVAHGVLAARRRVRQHTCDELGRLKGESLVLSVTVIDVAQAHRGAREIECLARPQGPTLDVAGEVQRNTAAVGIGL